MSCRRRKRHKKKMKALDKYVVFSLVALIVYTIAQLAVVVKTGVEASALTACFFGVFGGEILTCGLIKIFKLKDDKKESEDETNE